MTEGEQARGSRSSVGFHTLVAWRLDGRLPATSQPAAQTLLSAWTPGEGLAPLWIGLVGPDRRLTVLMSAAPGRSPHQWLGPSLLDPSLRGAALAELRKDNLN